MTNYSLVGPVGFIPMAWVWRDFTQWIQCALCNQATKENVFAGPVMSSLPNSFLFSLSLSNNNNNASTVMITEENPRQQEQKHNMGHSCWMMIVFIGSNI